MDDRRVFSVVFETLFKVLGPELTDGHADTFSRLGVNPKTTLATEYPVAVWASAIEKAAALRFPTADANRAQRMLGENFIQPFASTLVGKIVLSLARAAGPERALARLGKTYRSGGTYAESKMTKLGPGHVQVWMNAPYSTQHFDAGVIFAGLTATGVQEPSVELAKRSPDDAVYDVHWKV